MQSNVIVRVVQGYEKRQALNVIHVGVSKEQIGIEDIALVIHDFPAEGTDSRTCIDNDSLFATGHLEAGSVATILHGIGTGTWYTPANTPKLQLEGRLIRHLKNFVLS
tara:strand:- start:45 stop:368 length:324 start_codon:yes stop_codon:yes gene_type:complete